MYWLSAETIVRDVRIVLLFFEDLPVIAFKIIHGCC